jgi:hypothetical protein
MFFYPYFTQAGILIHHAPTSRACPQRGCFFYPYFTQAGILPHRAPIFRACAEQLIACFTHGEAFFHFIYPQFTLLHNCLIDYNLKTIFCCDFSV